MVEPRQQRRRGQHLAAGSRKLDRQRKTIQAAHDLHHRGGVLLGQGKGRVDCLGPRHKQRNRFVSRQIIENRALALQWQTKRGQGEFALGAEAEHLPARHQHDE
ncbi:MAG: hypothetical protein K6T59_18485 [Bryobacteraceae bacterium]|nr:hypothetical protein [Bryobacteraceae bacterium]